MAIPGVAPVAAQDRAPALDDLCSFDPAEFGIMPVASIPLRTDVAGADQIYLRAKVLRYESRAQKSQLALDGATREFAYRDVVILYHLPEAEMQAEIAKVEDALAKGGESRVADQAFCDFRSEAQLTLFSPFAASIDGENVAIAPGLVVLSRDVRATVTTQPLVRLPPSEDAIVSLLSGLGALPEAEPTNVASTPPPPTPPADDRPAPESEAATWQRNFYPWIVDLDFATLAPGDEVFAVDQVQCERAGNFIVGSTGSIALPEEREPASDEELPVRRQQMIAANLYFGASGEPLNQDAVAASVDDTAYWCIPKRELCYQQIDFGDFSIRARQGEIAQFNKNSVVSLQHGLGLALQRVVMDNCPQETFQEK